MTIHWDSLLTVFAVSSVATLAVVVLVTLALLGLSARAVGASGAATGRRLLPAPAAGTAVAVSCLLAAAGIVLFSLWVMVAR